MIEIKKYSVILLMNYSVSNMCKMIFSYKHSVEKNAKEKNKQRKVRKFPGSF